MRSSAALGGEARIQIPCDHDSAASVQNGVIQRNEFGSRQVPYASRNTFLNAGEGSRAQHAALRGACESAILATAVPRLHRSWAEDNACAAAQHGSADRAVRNASTSLEEPSARDSRSDLPQHTFDVWQDEAHYDIRTSGVHVCMIARIILRPWTRDR